MKHLLTAALIATALASPVRGEVIFREKAEVVLVEGEVLSSTTHVVDINQPHVIYYLLIRHRDAETGLYKIYNCEYIFNPGGRALSCETRD